MFKKIFLIMMTVLLAAGCNSTVADQESRKETPDPEPEIPAGNGPLVIMPLGDSLTNDSRSRVELWNLLTNDGYELDYVGNQHQTSSIPDPDHEGVGGIKIGGIMQKAEELMEQHKPRYVLLMVGTNDIAWYFDETAATIAARWDELVELIFTASEPGTRIIAATIPPVTSLDAGKEGMTERDRAVVVKQFNSELRSHISRRAGYGDPIYLADMEEALNPSLHLAGDGVHLNDEGYKIMGRVYYETLTDLLEP